MTIIIKAVLLVDVVAFNCVLFLVEECRHGSIAMGVKRQRPTYKRLNK